jgi:hypothetical protein
MRISEMKDPVIVFDGYHGLYWREDSCGYTGAQQQAGIYERHKAPKSTSDRRIELLPVPPDHVRYVAEQLEDARQRIAALEAHNKMLIEVLENVEVDVPEQFDYLGPGGYDDVRQEPNPRYAKLRAAIDAARGQG